jgi:RNA polymerase sigma factor (sigma-70 family)
LGVVARWSYVNETTSTGLDRNPVLWAGPPSAAPPVAASGFEELEPLYLQHCQSLVRLALLLTGSRADAPDLVHAALIKVARRLTTLDATPENLLAYVRRSIVNECRGWHRHRVVEQRHARFDPRISLPPELDEIWSALAELPERRRAALVLRFYHDLSIEQVADALDCRPGTAKSLIHRGLESLRKEMKP